MRSKLEYGAVIWDPFTPGFTRTDIDRIEKVQRKAARFIMRDFTSRESGCVTKMLEDLNLQSLESRRSQLRLVMFFKIVRGLVPAIDIENYLTPAREKRRIRPRKFSDYEVKNIVEKLETNNSRCFQIPQCNSDPFKYSFFNRTAQGWNQLNEVTISADIQHTLSRLLCRDTNNRIALALSPRRYLCQ